MGKRGPKPLDLDLTRSEREAIDAELTRRTLPRIVAVRCRIVLLRDAGESPTDIAATVGWQRPSVSTFLSRFRIERLAALHDKPRPGRPRAISPSGARGDRRPGVQPAE